MEGAEEGNSANTYFPRIQRTVQMYGLVMKIPALNFLPDEDILQTSMRRTAHGGHSFGK